MGCDLAHLRLLRDDIFWWVNLVFFGLRFEYYLIIGFFYRGYVWKYSFVLECRVTVLLLSRIFRQRKRHLGTLYLILRLRKLWVQPKLTLELLETEPLSEINGPWKMLLWLSWLQVGRPSSHHYWSSHSKQCSRRRQLDYLGGLVEQSCDIIGLLNEYRVQHL